MFLNSEEILALVALLRKSLVLEIAHVKILFQVDISSLFYVENPVNCKRALCCESCGRITPCMKFYVE